MVWLKLSQVHPTNAVPVLTKLTSYTSSFHRLIQYSNYNYVAYYLLHSICMWNRLRSLGVFGGVDGSREQMQGTQLCIWNPTLTLWLNEATRSVEKMNLTLRRFLNSLWHIGYCNDCHFLKTLIDLLNKGKVFLKLITFLFTPLISTRIKPGTSILMV